MKREKKNPFRLPDRFVFTALQLAVAGSLACSGETKSAPVDASGDVNATDATADVTADTIGNDSTLLDTATTDTAVADSANNDSTIADGSSGDVVTQDSSGDVQLGDACVVTGYCGPMPGVDAAACPGPICDLSQCPFDAGCEPFA